MRQLRKVLEAFSTLRREPGKAIADSWATVKSAVVVPQDPAAAANVKAAVDTIDSIVNAVVGDISTEKKKPEPKPESKEGQPS